MKFHNLLEEPLEFKSFLNDIVYQDFLLSRIWSFISDPPIETSDYPIERKINELIEITKKDNLMDVLKTIHLTIDSLIKRFQGSKHKRCYEHLEYLFTPPFFAILDKLNDDPEHPRNITEIYHQKAACYCIEYPETELETKDVRVCDFWMPKFREYNVQTYNKKTGCYIEEMCAEYYYLPGAKELLNFWDKYCSERYKDVNSNDLEGQKVYWDSENKFFFISARYKDVELMKFKYQIAQRYKKLVNAKVYDGKRKGLIRIVTTKTNKKRGKEERQNLSEEQKIFREDLYRKLNELARKFGAQEKIIYPAQFYSFGLRDYITRQFRSKEHTTTAWEMPCNEEMEDKWKFCRYKIPNNKENPYCVRRRNGFCTWSEAKRRTYAQIGGNGEDSERKQDQVQLDKWHKQGQDADRDYPWEKFEELTFDDIDKHIIECLKTGQYSFKKSKFDININFSAIARQIRVSYKTVIRRFKRMVTKIRK